MRCSWGESASMTACATESSMPRRRNSTNASSLAGSARKAAFSSSVYWRTSPGYTHCAVRWNST